MPRDYYADVRDFHKQMGLPALTRPDMSNEGHAAARIKMLIREVEEACEALHEKDPAHAAQELVDVCKMAMGTAVTFGLPFEEAWDAVTLANSRKQSRPGIEHGGYPIVFKPAGWQSPLPTIQAVCAGRRVKYGQDRISSATIAGAASGLMAGIMLGLMAVRLIGLIW